MNTIQILLRGIRIPAVLAVIALSSIVSAMTARMAGIRVPLRIGFAMRCLADFTGDCKSAWT